MGEVPMMQRGEWPQDRAGAHAAVLELVRTAQSRSYVAVVRAVLLRHQQQDRLAFGRIDLASPGRIPPAASDDLGRARILSDAVQPAALMDRLAGAFESKPFVIGDGSIVEHGLDLDWQGARFTTAKGPGLGGWPGFHARTSLPSHWPEVHDALHGASVYGNSIDLVGRVSHFPGYLGAHDARRRAFHIILWDERGRIDHLEVAGSIRVFTRTPEQAEQPWRVAACPMGLHQGEAVSVPAMPITALPSPGLFTALRVSLSCGSETVDERWWSVENATNSAGFPYARSQMTGAARDQLTKLRERLAATEPWPWTNIETWMAQARPLVRAEYTEHLDDFARVVEPPRWAQYAVAGSADRRSSAESSVLIGGTARAHAEAENRDRALAARSRVLAFVDGLLALPVPTFAAPAEPLVRLLSLLERFHLMARALAGPRWGGKPPLEITDEHDMQYLLGALLRLSFDDVRREDPAPANAGASSRLDFMLKPERILIEAKFVRPAGKSDKEIGEEISIDKQRYRAHPDCGTQVYFVYDPQHAIANPRGLERDLSETDPPVIVVVLPR